ncbi:MAG TPA: hypothetical protein PLH22_02375 [Candidatus Colwellbacteria bacterium]|nr:hypothetical protein [Candidatus Colwellbacteria bacterium]
MERKALFPGIKPPSGLEDKILKKIAEQERKTAVMRTAVFGIFGLTAATASVPAFIKAADLMEQSNFLAYASLVFSDSRIILSNLSEFLTAIIEAMPLTEIAIVLSLILAGLWSIAAVAKSIPAVRMVKGI